MEPKYLLPGAALLSLVSGPAGAAFIGTFAKTASSATPSPLGSTGLGPHGAIGGMIGGAMAFTAPSAGLLTIEVDDLAQQGDVYQVFVNGHSLGFTDPVPLDPNGTNLSTGIFAVPVAAGANTFDVNDQILSYIGFASPYGEVPPATGVPSTYTPAGLLVSLSEGPIAIVTPEPGTLAVFGSWLLGLGLLGRFRKTGRRA